MTAGRISVTKKKDWGTPIKYVNAVKKVFKQGVFLDPCSNRFSIVKAKTEFILPTRDGLKEEWNYPTIYVNPPYGKDAARGTTIKNWLIKCVQAHEDYHSEVLALIPVAVNTLHWKKCVFIKARAVCFLYDTRLKFLEDGLDTGKGAPMACAMVYWGSNYKTFFKVFINHGAVIDLSNLKEESIGETRKFMKII